MTGLLIFAGIVAAGALVVGLAVIGDKVGNWVGDATDSDAAAATAFVMVSFILPVAIGAGIIVEMGL